MKQKIRWQWYNVSFLYFARKYKEDVFQLQFQTQGEFSNFCTRANLPILWGRLIPQRELFITIKKKFSLRRTQILFFT